VAYALAHKAYPAEALNESWRTLLFHQFHDILCGCAIGSTYKEAATRLEPVLQAISATTEETIRGLSEVADTGTGEGPRCVVWNPLAWTRSDIVRLPVGAFGAVPASMVDDKGVALPVQVAGDQLLFVARDVPALGFRTYRPGDDPQSSHLEAQENATLRNGYLSFHVHPGSGAIDDMADLEIGRTIDTMSGWHGVERKQNAGMINRLQVLWEEPHPMSAWNIGDITRTESILRGAQVRVLERGPVRAMVEVVHHVLCSTITQRYCLYDGLRRVDIETDLDWHERGGKDADAPMLRALFRPQLQDAEATFEVPYAGLARTPSGDEVPALRWADLSAADSGFSLLNNGKYGHSAHGTTLGLTLVRAAYEPDGQPDQGRQSFAYALYPHRGRWQEAHTDRRAAEFNQPLVAGLTGAHAGPLQPNQAFLSCDAPNAMIAAVKQAEVGQGAIVVRLVEMHGRAANVGLRWALPTKRVEEVNVAEEPIRDVPFEPNGCTLTLGRHKVITLRLWLA
jgi:alpha-mannosidase